MIKKIIFSNAFIRFILDIPMYLLGISIGVVFYTLFCKYFDYNITIHFVIETNIFILFLLLISDEFISFIQKIKNTNNKYIYINEIKIKRNLIVPLIIFTSLVFLSSIEYIFQGGMKKCEIISSSVIYLMVVGPLFFIVKKYIYNKRNYALSIMKEFNIDDDEYIFKLLNKLYIEGETKNSSFIKELINRIKYGSRNK